MKVKTLVDQLLQQDQEEEILVDFFPKEEDSWALLGEPDYVSHFGDKVYLSVFEEEDHGKR